MYIHKNLYSTRKIIYQRQNDRHNIPYIRIATYIFLPAFLDSHFFFFFPFFFSFRFFLRFFSVSFLKCFSDFFSSSHMVFWFVSRVWAHRRAPQFAPFGTVTSTSTNSPSYQLAHISPCVRHPGFKTSTLVGSKLGPQSPWAPSKNPPQSAPPSGNQYPDPRSCHIPSTIWPPRNTGIEPLPFAMPVSSTLSPHKPHSKPGIEQDSSSRPMQSKPSPREHRAQRKLRLQPIQSSHRCSKKTSQRQAPRQTILFCTSPQLLAWPRQRPSLVRLWFWAIIFSPDGWSWSGRAVTGAGLRAISSSLLLFQPLRTSAIVETSLYLHLTFKLSWLSLPLRLIFKLP